MEIGQQRGFAGRGEVRGGELGQVEIAFVVVGIEGQPKRRRFAAVPGHACGIMRVQRVGGRTQGLQRALTPDAVDHQHRGAPRPGRRCGLRDHRRRIQLIGWLTHDPAHSAARYLTVSPKPRKASSPAEPDVKPTLATFAPHDRYTPSATELRKSHMPQMFDWIFYAIVVLLPAYLVIDYLRDH